MLGETTLFACWDRIVLFVEGCFSFTKKLERKAMRMLSAPAENETREERALHSEEEDISLR